MAITCDTLSMSKVDKRIETKDRLWRDLIAETAEQAIIRAQEIAGSLNNALILIAVINSEREGNACDQTALSNRIGLPRATLIRRIDDLAKRGHVRIERLNNRKVIIVTSKTKRQLFQIPGDRFAAISRALLLPPTSDT